MTMEFWWERDDLRYNGNNELMFANHNVQQYAQQLGTPLFLYSAQRLRANIRRLEQALSQTGLPHRVLYALKANRHQPLLTFIKTATNCGIDACAPAEVRRALGCGFIPADISYTGTSVSNADLEFLLGLDTLHLNCDGLSMIKRVGLRCPGREIGIRINPAMGTGYGANELLRYSGEKPTKFGIYASELSKAIELASQYNLTITRIHFHTGCGYLNDQLPIWEDILAHCLEMIRPIPTVRAVNLGGGLGVPLTREDRQLDLKQWATIIGRVFGQSGYEINVEPGTYIAKDAGMLVLEANTVETKSGKRFIGVNGGFNLTMEPVHYQLPAEPVCCCLPEDRELFFAAHRLQPTTFAGNINEALDILYDDLPFPQLQEGTLLALINAGAYTSSMYSNHCMRGAFTECLLLDSMQP